MTAFSARNGYFDKISLLVIIITIMVSIVVSSSVVRNLLGRTDNTAITLYTLIICQIDHVCMLVLQTVFIVLMLEILTRIVNEFTFKILVTKIG